MDGLLSTDLKCQCRGEVISLGGGVMRKGRGGTWAQRIKIHGWKVWYGLSEGIEVGINIIGLLGSTKIGIYGIWSLVVLILNLGCLYLPVTFLDALTWLELDLHL